MSEAVVAVRGQVGEWSELGRRELTKYEPDVPSRLIRWDIYGEFTTCSKTAWVRSPLTRYELNAPILVDLRPTYTDNPLGVWRRPPLDLGLSGDSIRNLLETVRTWDGTEEPGGLDFVGLYVWLAVAERSGAIITKH